VESGQFLEGIVADDIRVEHEERCVIFAENSFGELERTSGAERFGFDAELDVHIVFLFPLECSCQDQVCLGKGNEELYLLQPLGHNLRSVVYGEDNVRDTGSGESLDLVQHHRLVGEFYEGFGEREGLYEVRFLLQF